jgi:ABC-2 type transport system ATP-binding protein
MSEQAREEPTTTPAMDTTAGLADTVPDAVRVRDLHVAFDPRGLGKPTPVLQGVDLSAPQGQVTALVGTNGAGKTTLLRTIIGALRPASGSIEVAGRPMGGAEDRLPQGVGVVPDQPMFPPDWSADDVAKLYRRHMPGFDAHVMGRHLRLGGVEPWAQIKRLSAGRQTQLSLAAALAADPHLLILDEPLARLDPLARPDLVDRLRDHMARGEDRTVLVSTHDMDGMDRFVDHLVVLHAGASVLEGDVDELLEGHLVVDLARDAARVLEPAADGQGPILRGAHRSGADQVEALVRADDAAALPPSAGLRAPELRELVAFVLRDAASGGGRHDDDGAN